MNTRKNNLKPLEPIKTRLVNEDGSINLVEFEIDGVSARIVGTQTGGRKVSEAIDEVRFETGERRYYTRGELYLLEKNNKIKLV
ncbi:MAG TPA: hypothetical protein VNR38_01055 [Ureibacillus sp.]|nr:hypothetical protein [Ureibacillus sp.]